MPTRGARQLLLRFGKLVNPPHPDWSARTARRVTAAMAVLAMLFVQAAAAAWLISSAPGAAAAARASSVPQVTGATASFAAGAVAVSWQPVTLTSGGPVDGYTVTAYPSGGGSPRTPGGTCAALVTGTACTDSAAPAGTWDYRIAAKFVTWSGPESGPASVTTGANEVVAENSKPGNPSSEWQVSGAGDPTIQGFTTDISADQGGTVSFKVDTTATAFRIDVYRLGWYGGDGARKVATIPDTATTATSQVGCQRDSTGIADCGNWSVSASWTVPADATSGLYLARLVRSDNGGASHVPFVVRDDNGGSNLVMQTSDTTWQAYNRYGGASLYTGDGPGTGGNADGRAYKVSYNRPFTTRDYAPEDWLFNTEYPMIRWLERNGYDVSYISGVDTHRSGSELLEHKAFVSVGHDEYWSGQQRTNVEAARAAGVNLAFFSGNEVFWRTRYENGIGGSATNQRTLVAYKETHNYPNNPDPTNEWTGTWRDSRDADSVNKPENGLTGTIFTVNSGSSEMTVPAEDGALRLWRNSSVAGSPGADTFGPDVVGYEWDEDLDNGSRPGGQIQLSETTVNNVQKVDPAFYGSTFVNGAATHHLTMHKDQASGALVFGAGTVQWSWGLDSVHDRGNAPDVPAIQQATVNLFADMGVQAPTLQVGLVAATQSTDAAAPTSVITSPSDLSTVPAGSTVTVTGTAVDTGGLVGGVEVSTDNGATWHPATGRTTWQYAFSAPATNGISVVLRSRATDDSLNTGAASAAVTVTTSPTVCAQPTPCSIFATAAPSTIDANDGQSIEVGVRFRADTAGRITGVRFFKPGAATGTYTGRLYTDAGGLLGSSAATSVTGAGWQVLPLTAAVDVAAGTTYVSSYFSLSGQFAYTSGTSPGNLNTAVVRPPLTALANSLATPNAVYRYSGGFPDQGGTGVNYWADVTFESGSDTTAPTITARTPGPGATDVSQATGVTVSFSEAIAPASVTPSSFTLTGPGGAVSGTRTVNGATLTFTPTVALDGQTTYTVFVKGDPGGVTDVAGNPLAADTSWTFTVRAAPAARPDPNVGPGGPVIVVKGSGAFGSYLPEIMRAEGLNLFTVGTTAALDESGLAPYKTVVLGETTLTTAQVTALTTWVTGGGNLVALRPDPALASLLGLTAAGTTLSEGYLKVDTATSPGAGIVGQTMQFHGTADRYTAQVGTQVVATLYSNATTATTDPAVTLRSVGTAGGSAAAFTYDLARSVVLTRQGNPAWVNQNRDGQSGPNRADDLFYGAMAGDVQPDYVDLSKVAIPQADEQQRLLANVLTETTLDALPLPRFWYLPRGEVAAIVMTADEHDGGNVPARFQQELAASPVACSVADWECIRSTSYLYPTYPTSSMNATLAKSYQDQGFEIALHTNTGCSSYSRSQYADALSVQLAALAAKYPSVDASTTNRNHCIAWTDYTTVPEELTKQGINLDTNYYYWPPGWVNDVPGMFTGSGFAQRFATTGGDLVDVYQATTQMTDESGQSFPSTAIALMDGAINNGFYGTFVANLHSDGANAGQYDADVIAAAKARSVPVISAKQLLTWTDGRNASDFSNLAWNSGTGTLTFGISLGTGARGLESMLPLTSAGGTMTTLTGPSGPVSWVPRTVKGVEYAVFAAAAGAWTATYAVPAPDNTAPTVTSTSPLNAAIGVQVSANMTATFSEPVKTTTVTTTTFTLTGPGNTPVPAAVSTVGATVTLNPTADLTPGTTYTATLTGGPGGITDQANNPLAADSTWTFTTAADLPPPAAPPVVDTHAPPVQLGTVIEQDDFTGTGLPVGWTARAVPWTSGGTATVGGGVLAVDGTAAAGTAGRFSAVEAVVTFGGDQFQNVGLAGDLDFNNPWFTFGIGGSTDQVYVRGSDGLSIGLGGSLIGTAHTYRIEWTPSEVRWLVDGALRHTQTVAAPGPLVPIISDYNAGGTGVVVDSVKTERFVDNPGGEFLSQVFDAGVTSTWGVVDWTAALPAGTSLQVQIRTGETSSPDGTWSPFTTVAKGTVPTVPAARHLQYKLVLTSSDSRVTPTVTSVSIG